MPDLSPAQERCLRFTIVWADRDGKSSGPNSRQRRTFEILAAKGLIERDPRSIGGYLPTDLGRAALASIPTDHRKD